MFDEHPSSLLPSSSSETDLFKSVATLMLSSNSNSDSDTAWAHHRSEHVPGVSLSTSFCEFFSSNCFDDDNDDDACDHTSWVPPELVPPGLAFDDDDLSVASFQQGVNSSFPTVHDQNQEVKGSLNDIFLLNSDVFHDDQDNARVSSSAGAVPRHLNIVSPVAKPNFVKTHELHFGHDLPMGRLLLADLEMEAGEKSVRQPHFNTRCLPAKDTLWMQHYRELQAFKAEYGHTYVPQTYKNVSLGNWVKYNRHKMREWDNSCHSEEEKEKMKLLIEIGMTSHIGKGNAPKVNGVTLSQRQIQAWDAQFTSLCEYKEEYGDCDVPTNEIGRWRTLGEWVKRQRKVYRNFHSAQEAQNNPTNRYLLERFDRLRKVGFKFRIGSGCRGRMKND